MRANRHLIATGFAATAILSAAVVPAHAACTRLAFSVNDYGKDGPIKDAKSLLDKYVAKWAAERNITKYRTGPKSVNCELFLDVIVFDEHTCRAEATVCWDGPALAKPQSAAAVEGAQPAAKAAAEGAEGAVKRAQAPAGAIKIKPAKIETGTLPAPAGATPVTPAPAALPAAVTPKPITAPAAVIPAPAKPEIAKAEPVKLEPAKPEPTKGVAAPTAAATSPNALADQAVIAAEKAAAAAERAALAAERAAAAAAKLEQAPAAKP